MSFSRLLSADEPATAAELLAEVRPRERAGEDRPFVFVNMVSTIDGRAQLGGAAQGAQARRFHPARRARSTSARTRQP